MIGNVTFEPVFHRDSERVLLRYDRSYTIDKAVRNIPGVRWSKTFRSWHIPLDKPTCKTAIEKLQPFATTNITPLSIYLKNKQQHNAEVQASVSEWDTPTSYTPNHFYRYQPEPISQHPLRKISDENLHALQRMTEHLQLKAYSSSTIKTYRGEMIAFMQFLGKHHVSTLTPEHIRRYLHYCITELQLSENTIHSRLNALKYYYEQVLGRSRFLIELPRPKKPLQLPKLLNEKELSKLFNSLTNKKHKAMLFTAYSAGLRVSELANLQIADVDSGRMQLRIARAKGKKDRYVNLSPVLLDILREYYTTYTPRPQVYLFESEQTGTAYPTRTIQQIFSNAKAKGGIRKEVGVHSLRHSFATHLLDKGTDIKYIKELLGHFNIKTTERYLHVSHKKLVNVISPFDDLMRTGTVEW
jgi:integrase/recombinase XerD